MTPEELQETVDAFVEAMDDYAIAPVARRADGVDLDFVVRGERVGVLAVALLGGNRWLVVDEAGALRLFRGERISLVHRPPRASVRS